MKYIELTFFLWSTEFLESLNIGSEGSKLPCLKAVLSQRGPLTEILLKISKVSGAFVMCSVFCEAACDIHGDVDKWKTRRVFPVPRADDMLRHFYGFLMFFQFCISGFSGSKLTRLRRRWLLPCGMLVVIAACKNHTRFGKALVGGTGNKTFNLWKLLYNIL